MNREEAHALVADVMAEHFERLRLDLEARIAARPLPPFVPPAPWMAGTHAAGAVVRHRNGIFYARRDTGDEPPSDAWLPLLVGVAAVECQLDERNVMLRVDLSDGSSSSHQVELAVPIGRGYWESEREYRPGDRVVRYGEWQCIKAALGIDPAVDGSAHWLKLTGKASKASTAAFSLDDEGNLYESGRQVGSIKPLIEQLLGKLTGVQL